MDLDVDNALRFRELSAASNASWTTHEARQGRSRLSAAKAIERMRDDRPYVWEPDALEACSVFWQRRENREDFEALCLKDGEPRFLPDLLQGCFYYFPAGGPVVDVPIRGGEATPWSLRVCPPWLMILGLKVYDGGNPSPSIVGLMEYNYLPADSDPGTHEGRHKLSQELSGIPIRDIPRHPKIKVWTLERFPEVYGEVIRDKLSVDWILQVYRMRLFLETPFVGHRQTRVKRKEGRKIGLQKDAEVVTAYMREAFGRNIPRFQRPLVSRVTGRTLNFEVDVKAHLRHCHSGKVAPVKAHKRGPRGVTREKVVKVIH